MRGGGWLGLVLGMACSASFEGDPKGLRPERPGEADGDVDADSDGDTDADADADGDADGDGDADADADADGDVDTGGLVFDAGAPYPALDDYDLKGLQPDYWPDLDEVVGNAVGAVSMNLVWATWEPVRSAPPCAAGAVPYGGHCYTVEPNVDAAIAAYSGRGVAVTAVVYGVPDWARVGRACSPAAPGFEVFCAPDDPADYAAFIGMLARLYNGANGHGRVADFVVHNEVNSNTWFDIGCGQGTPCDVGAWTGAIVDNYVAAFDAVRAEQSAAKVFVSLDHHFGSPDFDLPAADQPLLAGQTVLLALAAGAGGRDWRVAFHPYPPDLLAPEFSPDDLPRVTYGSLGALPGWLYTQWPGSAAATDIHLTESGVNSLSPSSEAAQAEGLCRSYEAVIGTPGVSRYIYHRMTDHPDETAAGLGVGLHNADGSAKAAWSTFALANRADLVPPQLSCGFEQLPYTALSRSYKASRGHWASTRPAPAGFATEATWHLLRTAASGATLLFECAVGGHNLLTPDPNCEGLVPLGPVGWIWDAAGGARVGLYRCRVSSSGDHFISPDPACEGQVVEQLLGYAEP